MALSRKHLEDICCLGKGYLECKYLAHDDLQFNKCYCLKQTVKKAKIDKNVKDFLEKCKNDGTDPVLEGEPIGDNCQGYPSLKYTEQGYDV